MSPADDTVIVGVPTIVSLYVNVALLNPAAIVIVAVDENVPPAEVDVSEIVVPPAGAKVKLPFASRSTTVMLVELLF